MEENLNRRYEFGQFRLDTGERILLRGDEVVPLTPKAFDLLATLVGQHGHLIGKEELLKTLWPDSFVEEIIMSEPLLKTRNSLPPIRGWQAVT